MVIQLSFFTPGMGIFFVHVFVIVYRTLPRPNETVEKLAVLQKGGKRFKEDIAMIVRTIL